MVRSSGRRGQFSLLEKPNLAARASKSNHSMQTNKSSSSIAGALKHRANHSSIVTNGEYKVLDEYEKERETHEEDAGVLECRKEDSDLPRGEEMEFLKQRKRLKVTVRKQMNKELGTADPNSRDKTSVVHRKNCGSFFESSQSVIASGVIQESKSMLNHPNSAARASKSNHTLAVGSVSPKISMVCSSGRRGQFPLLENPKLTARVSKSNHFMQTNKSSSSIAGALKRRANHSSRVTNGEYKVLDEYEEEHEKYKGDGGAQECREEDSHLPRQEELEVLEQRKRLKVTVRKQMNKELGTADPSSRDKTSVVHRKNSFFGSQSAINSGVIQESKSLLKHPNLTARVSKSNHSIPVGSVTSIRLDYPKIYFRIGTTGNIGKVLKSSSLPDDMIFEILSWLPTKSLLRFKCVSKMWCSIIQDRKFMDEHRHRTSCTMIYRNPVIWRNEDLVIRDENFDPGEGEDAYFHLVAYQKGVILEENVKTRAHRLRNPAIRQMLHLPNMTKYVGMCYIPATNDLKLVGLYHYFGYCQAYSIATVDTRIPWRFLYPSTTREYNRFRQATKVIGTTFYSIKLGYDGNHVIDCVDLEIEKIINTVKIPHDFFLDWSDVWPVVWNSKLSLASIEQEQLHVRVLENYSKQKWADSKIIIPLTFLKYIGNMSSEDIMPCMMIGNKLWSWFSRDNCYRTFFSFDIESQKVRFIRSRTRMRIPYLYRPSMCSFKGMRPYVRDA